jgi:cell division protein FtsL
MRSVNLFLIGCLITLSFVIYEVKYETREMEARVSELRSEIRKEREAIAVLRAEWSHLNRPERIERLARKHLDLEPVQARQMMTPADFAAKFRKTPAGPVSVNADAELRQPVSAVR